jgi:hypothetical protein
VTLIVYTDNSDSGYQQQLFDTYSQYIDKNRLKIVQVPNQGQSYFWSRDGLPLPVWNTNNLGLVDAKYYYGFASDAFFGKLFEAPVTSHNYFYEGGNFMANAKGDCLVVNRDQQYPGGTSDTAAIPDSIFTGLYGCKTLTRLQHLKGIGHADEVVKFMADDLVITDTAEYKPILEKAGFKVVMMPEANEAYETYINAVIVNDTVIVPVFGESNDASVLKTFQSFGFKTVAINTHDLATQGEGGIHCITMNYPPVTLDEVLVKINGTLVK